MAAASARELGRPVKLVLSRRQMYSLNGHRPATTQTVTLGNFRKEVSSGKDNCNDAKVGTFEWPFDPAEALDNRQSVVPAGEEDDIKFKAKNLPGTYYFDVCLGSVKVDPRLIIDP